MEQLTYKLKETYCRYLLRRFSEEQKNEVNEISQLSIRVEKALNRMDRELRTLLLNDFVYANDRYWYLGYYSRSTYYRLKSKSMEQFIDFFSRNMI